VSGLVAGAKAVPRRLLGRGAPLDARLAGLEQAVEAGRGRLDDAVVDPASVVVERAGNRLRLSADHTVVALAGATGSGKSSTFNALTGLELAAVGVRRPTTSSATACIWGADPADALLDWLDIPPRHRVLHDSMLDEARSDKARGDRTQPDKALGGLVLLDLPDHDSTEVSHHLEAGRLVAMTDLMVWVLDPQKYADAAIHDRFLKPMATHREVMLVVLNHIDEVPEERRASMVGDVRRLLELDGLDGVPLLAISARTGEGISELRQAIGKRVGDKASTRTRLAGDIADAAERMTAHSGDAAPRQLGAKDQRELMDALADAAGVPTVVDAVRRATAIRARRATGWPLTAWVSRLKPDPLRRLHLDRGTSGQDLVAAARSSMPTVGHVQQARVETTVRDLCDDVSDGLAQPWVRSVRQASTSRFADLGDRLDRAVTTTDLGVTGVPLWCRAVRMLQWVLFATALAGALWLGVLAFTSYLQVPQPGTPDYRGFPVPTLLLVLGVLAGVGLALLSRALISIGSKSRARKADKRLRAAVSEVAEELVIAPVTAELAAYRTTWEGLRAARG
jgi:GTP-binding protein EngB required for normal cell division